MEYIPLYARGGAVIPLWPAAPASTADYHPQTIELHVFLPDEDGEYHSCLHEDDGLTFDFKDGAYCRTDFTLRKAGANLTLEGSISGDGYAEFARQEFHVVFHGQVPASVRMNNETLVQQDGRFVLPNAGAGFRLEAAAD
jgi:alpha-glucosidase